MKLASAALAVLSALTLAAAHAQPVAPQDRANASANKKDARNAHKHKPGEKHRENEDQPKTGQKAKS